MQKATRQSDSWMTVTHDKDLNITEITNPIKEVMLQCTVEDFIGKNVRDLSKIARGSNSAPADIITRSVIKAASSSKPVYFEYSSTQADNSTVYSICFAKKEDDGNTQVTVIQVDEEELFAGRRDFSSYINDVTINNIAVGAYMSHFTNNGTKRYVIFNDRAKRLYGCDDIFKSRFWDQKEDDMYDENVLKTGELVRYEKSFYDEEGLVKYWLVFYKKELKSRANGYYIITTIIDITNKKTNTLKLEETQRNLSFALSAGNTIAWKYDIATEMFYTFLGTNLLGTQEMSYKDADSILHPDDIPLMKQVFDEIIIGKSRRKSVHLRFFDKKTGEYQYFLSDMEAREDEKGNVTSIFGVQRNITEERDRKNELERSRDELSLALEAGELSAWSYVFKDKSFYTLYGSAVAGKGLSLDDANSLFHPDDALYMNQLISDMEKGAKERDKKTIRFKDENGQYRYLESTMILRREDRVPVSITGTQKDITELVALNKEVQAQNKINRLILDNINSGLLFMNADCSIEWSNLHDFKPIMEAMGIKAYTKGEHCDFYSTCDGKFKCTGYDRCLVKPAIQSGTIKKKNFVYNDKYIESFAIPVSDDSGNMIGALLKLNDVSERENLYSEITHAKEDALSSNQILSIVLDRIPCALFIKDASKGFKYTTANKMFCETIGKKESEIVGKTDYDIFSKVYADKYRSYDQRMADGEQFVSYETSMPYNGKSIDWLIYKSIIQSAEGDNLILCIAADVSDIYKANLALKEAQKKAEQSDKLKSAFLANMSHEIRTPLNAIVGFSDLLTMTDDDNEKKEYCKIITTNSEMLLRLIGDILDLSKIEAGMMDYKHEKVNISAFFQELMSSLKLKATNPDVDFIVDNPYKECYVALDKNRFSQVITNFVSNAIKYTPSGYIKAGYNIVDGGLKVYVQDTGIGIPESKKERVFHRFEKLDSFAQGTGLGLSIAKAIAESDGGKVGFESQEGKGSTFWMWMPMKYVTIPSSAKSISDTEATTIVEQDRSTQIKRILVAEDNDSNFILIKSILKGFDVTRATNGAEAVEKAVKTRFDIILMDIKMPVMDGLEATRRIKAFDKDAYIIAVTANAFLSDREAAHNAGCDDFLAKPVKKADILDAISKK